MAQLSADLLRLSTVLCAAMVSLSRVVSTVLRAASVSLSGIISTVLHAASVSLSGASPQWR